MKQLIYVPIIHMSADLGSIAKQVDKRGVADLGEEFWKKHRETVSVFWDVIAKYFADSSDVGGYKIYQDGMVGDGEVGQMIVEGGIKAGSKNYEVINDLLARGAVLVQTEDFSLVKKERDYIVKITKAKTITQKIIAYLWYVFNKSGLLKKRDEYIVKKIEDTLNHGETGILFMGAYHNIIPKLPKGLLVTEVKDVKKVRDYQRLLLRYSANKEEFEALAKYLVSPIK